MVIDERSPCLAEERSASGAFLFHEKREEKPRTVWVGGEMPAPFLAKMEAPFAVFPALISFLS